jgi:hypothetical protein
VRPFLQAPQPALWKAQREAGKKPGGKEPEPPQAGPNDGDQVNLTDEQSRIMPVSGGGFEQSYNAQAGVDIDTMMVITVHVTQACNDKREVAPTLAQIAALHVRAAHRNALRTELRGPEWLLIEWPEDEPEPTKYWLSTRPESPRDSWRLFGLSQAANMAA